MTERMETINGTMEIVSAPSEGATITLRLPLK
jgi:signal transduction histidine kinase